MPHTPGPWQHGEPTFAVPDRFVRTADGQVIAYCDGPLDVAKANAKVIAALPELLEALRTIEAHCEHAWVEGPNNVRVLLLGAAQAAITKAEL